MSNISFSMSSKQQSARVKKPLSPPSDSSKKNYVTEFSPGEKPPQEPEAKNLPNIPQLSQTGDASIQFELYAGSNADGSDGSMSFGLNVSQPPDRTIGAAEKITDLEWRMFMEDLQMLPDHMGMEEFNEMPVEEFGAYLLRGYGWKEGMGIGRNAKEDVKVVQVVKNIGRGGLGFSGNDDNVGEKNGEGNSESGQIVNQMEGFDEMPVEEFGASLLRGYGWKEGHAGSNADGSDGSMSFGLNVSQPVDRTTGAAEKITDLEWRRFRKDLQILPDHMGMEEFNKMPVEEFGAALLRGYGWKEWMGIGRNAKEDVKVVQVVKNIGRGGLGFSGNDGNIGEKNGERNIEPGQIVNQKEDKGFGVEKEVRIDEGIGIA